MNYYLLYFISIFYSLLLNSIYNLYPIINNQFTINYFLIIIYINITYLFKIILLFYIPLLSSLPLLIVSLKIYIIQLSLSFIYKLKYLTRFNE